MLLCGMAKRATLPKANDLPPWAKADVVKDFAEGRTNGEAWDWHDGLVAQLAVAAHRKQRIENDDLKTTLRVVSNMGLLPFVRLYLREAWMCWWWAVSFDD